MPCEVETEVIEVNVGTLDLRNCTQVVVEPLVSFFFGLVSFRGWLRRELACFMTFY